MGLIHETLPVAAGYNNFQPLLLSATGVIGLGTAAFKTVETVHQSEMGIKTRFGRPLEKKGLTEDQISTEGKYQVVGPKTYLLIPFFEKIVRVNTAHRSDPVDGFDVESSDGLKHEVQPYFTWYVRSDGDNPYYSKFNVNNEKDNKDKEKDFELKQTVLSICADGLRKVLAGRTSQELIDSNSESLTAENEEVCRDKLLEYGAALYRVTLKSITRKDVEVLKQGLENSNNPNDGLIATAVEADERGMGKVIPFPFPTDAA